MAEVWVCQAQSVRLGAEGEELGVHSEGRESPMPSLPLLLASARSHHTACPDLQAAESSTLDCDLVSCESHELSPFCAFITALQTLSSPPRSLAEIAADSSR